MAMFQVLQDAQAELDRVTSVEKSLQESVMTIENELQSAKGLHLSCLQDVHSCKSRDDSAIAEALRRHSMQAWQRELSTTADKLHCNVAACKLLLTEVAALVSKSSPSLLDGPSVCSTLVGEKVSAEGRRKEAQARAQQAKERLSMAREDHMAAEQALNVSSLRLARARSDKDAILTVVSAGREALLAVSSLQQARREEAVAADRAAEAAVQQATSAAAKLQAAMKRKAQQPTK